MFTTSFVVRIHGKEKNYVILGVMCICLRKLDLKEVKKSCVSLLN